MTFPSAPYDGEQWVVGGASWIWSAANNRWEGRGSIPTGEQGPEGPQGSIGPQGPEGPIGLTGPQGPPGTGGGDGTGGAGPQGPIGPQGPQGAVGAISTQPGPTGPQGPSGAPGATGGAGNAGPQGSVGPQGAAGSGVSILGSLTSSTQLPATGTPGDAYLIAGDLWVYTGTGTPPWQNVGSIQGPQGTQGPQGAIGVGTQGPQGPSGPQGSIGPTGVGTQGPQGPQGAVGPQGSTGPGSTQAGPQGSQGPQGPTGAIADPTTAGNFLRTNLGTWVAGLPLTGGTVTGATNFSSLVQFTNTTGNSVFASGSIQANGTITGNTLWVNTTGQINGGALTVTSGANTPSSITLANTIGAWQLQIDAGTGSLSFMQSGGANRLWIDLSGNFNMPGALAVAHDITAGGAIAANTMWIAGGGIQSSGGNLSAMNVLPQQGNWTGNVGIDGSDAWANVAAYNFQQQSDPAMKRDIEDVPDGVLAKLLEVKVKTFRMKEEADDAPVHVGFMAPELAKAFGARFTQGSYPLADEIAVLWKAVQEMHHELTQALDAIHNHTEMPPAKRHFFWRRKDG